MPGKLFEVPRSQWCILRDLYEPHKRETCSYYFLQTCIDWVKRCPNFIIKIYVINNDWQIDGTFIADIPLFRHLYCNTLNKDDYNLEKVLQNYDPKLDYLFFGFPDLASNAIKKYYVAWNFDSTYFDPDGCCWYTLSPTEAPKSIIRVPEGYTLSRLGSEHVRKINDTWTYKGAGTFDFINHLVAYNDSIGAFDREDNLIAWCLILPMGELGILKVEEPHRRKGLASILVKSLTKTRASKGNDSFAAVVPSNLPCRQMLEKIGFRHIGTSNWTYTPSN